MKIGFVLDDGLDKPDGVQQYILTLGKELVKKGHEVVYLVGETNKAFSDIRIYSMAKNVKVRFNGNALSIPLPASKKKIKYILNKEKFDVLHVQVPYSPFMAAKVVKYCSPKTIVVGTFHILPYGWLSRVGTKLLGVWLRFNLKRFNFFISVSQPAADFALQFFKINSQVIPNMVDTSKFKVAGPTNKSSLNLLFLGRLVYRKGCQQLLKALVILKQESNLPSGLELSICGDGPMRSQLENYVLKNGLESQVKFHGFISDFKKIEFMRSADFSIFPAISGESFGIVLIEAMAAGGGIVLGGDNPGYKSVLKDVPESIIDSNSPSKIAAGLKELINDPQKKKELYSKQQALVQQFDSGLVSTKVLSVYEACKKQQANQ